MAFYVKTFQRVFIFLNWPFANLTNFIPFSAVTIFRGLEVKIWRIFDKSSLTLKLSAFLSLALASVSILLSNIFVVIY